MSNTIFITANWTTGALSQQTISRQYDNNRYAVQFIGYPEGDGTEELDLYLLVWMSTAPGQKPGEITPIQLNSDQWYISNYFTQQVQVIKFQLCVLNEAGTYEAHSPIFSGMIGDSLEHNGTSHDIDVSTLFDAYREYVEELVIGAGAVIIDHAPTQGSTNAVSSGGVYDALQSAGLSEDAKTALLACFQHVAWTDEHGQDYYDALESTLYPATGLVRIEATFTQGSTAIYEDDELNDLKAYLVVTGYYNDGTSRTETDYALIGELTEGTSIITVSKDQKTTTFNVTVSPPYWDYKWDASSGVLPEGMTAYRYNFTEEPGALYVENPVLDFNYIGDCRLMVECKWYCFDEDLTTSEFIEEVLWGNNPQLFALNKVDGNQKTGSRVIGHASVSGSGRDMRFLAGQSEASYGYKDNVYRIYDLTANGNEYSIVLPNDSFSVSGSGMTSQYNQHTGISSVYPPMTTNNKRTITALFIKSIKFKKF